MGEVSTTTILVSVAYYATLAWAFRAFGRWIDRM